MITIKLGNYELFSTRIFGILSDRRHDWRSASTSDIANWRESLIWRVFERVIAN